MTDYASEKGRFYDRQGNPCYTYLNKKGEEKNTTLREARKLSLVPSVTTIIALADRPSLNNWKQDQTILACLTLPKVDGETEQDYIKRIKEDAKAQAKKAAERGTEIHGYLEWGFRGVLTEINKYYDSVIRTITKECGLQAWSTEKSFASPLGYGGKVDLHNEAYLIDFKGTDKPLDSLSVYLDHHMQLSAYDSGIAPTGRKCGICYVHRDTAESRLIWIPEKDLMKGFVCFLALLDFYYARTGLIR